MKRIAILVLLLLVAIRLVVSPYPFSEDAPLGTDHQCYLHYIQVIKDHGAVVWDEYWYGGMPFLKFYPPLSFYLAAALPFSDLVSYKLMFMLFWALTPLAAFLMFKEFRLREGQTLVATALFSLSTFHAVRFGFGGMPMFVAIFFSLLFLKYFIRLVDTGSRKDAALSTLFLASTILTHFVPFLLSIVVSLAYLFYNRFSANLKKVSYKPIWLVYVCSFVLSSWWLVPALMEMPNGNNLEGPAYTWLVPIKFVFNSFGYYWNLISLLSVALFLYLLLQRLRQFRVWEERDSYVGEFSLLLLTVLFAVFMFSYGAYGDRTLILAAIPFSLLLATLSQRHRLILLLFIGLQAALFMSYLYPYQTVDISHEHEIAEYLSGTLFMGEQSALATVIPQGGGSNYMAYTLPKHGVRIAYGGYKPWLPEEKARLLEGDLNLNLRCTERYMPPLSLIDKNSFSKDVPCQIDNVPPQVFISANVNYIVADNNYQIVKTYFDDKGEKIFDSGYFSVYELE